MEIFKKTTKEELDLHLNSNKTPEEKEKFIKSLNPDQLISDTNTILSYIIENNIAKNFNLDKKIIFNLIKKSDLRVNSKKIIILNRLITLKQNKNVNLSTKDLLWIFENTPFEKDNFLFLEDIVTSIFSSNRKSYFNFKNDDLMEIIEKTKAHYKNNPFTSKRTINVITNICLKQNKNKHLNLTPKQILTLLQETDLDFKNDMKQIPIMALLQNNTKENLNLSADEIYPIIMKSNLNHIDAFSLTIADYVAIFNKYQKIFLNNEQTMMILKNSNLLNKEQGRDISLFTIIEANDKGKIILTNEQILDLIETTLKKAPKNYLQDKEEKKINELKTKYSFNILNKKIDQDNTAKTQIKPLKI
jgi:hypothetical protein